MNTAFDPILLALVALPALVALGLVGVGLVQAFAGLAPLPERVWRGVGLATGFVTFALTLFGVAFRFDPERLGYQLVARVGGALVDEPRLLLGVDGIGLCFLLSTAGLAPLAILSSRTETEDSVRSWIFVVLMLESSLLGAITSLNLYGFLFFWAQTLLPILHQVNGALKAVEPRKWLPQYKWRERQPFAEPLPPGDLGLQDEVLGVIKLQ